MKTQKKQKNEVSIEQLQDELVEALKWSYERACDLFGKENVTHAITEEIFDIVENADSADNALEELEMSKVAARKIYGDVEGAKPLAVLGVYERVFELDDDEDDDQN